jgi:hypothetical protein
MSPDVETLKSSAEYTAAVEGLTIEVMVKLTAVLAVRQPLPVSVIVMVVVPDAAAVQVPNPVRLPSVGVDELASNPALRVT